MTQEVFDRLKKESTELNEKIEKLTAFIAKNDNSVEPLHRDLLITQLNAMQTYYNILAIRIGLSTIEEHA